MTHYIDEQASNGNIKKLIQFYNKYEHSMFFILLFSLLILYFN
jgi:hypothetical protein